MRRTALLQMMGSIGADAGSQAFVANMVGEMENDIMSWTEVTQKNSLRTAAAASRAAEAAARLGGATSAADLKRSQVIIELQLKEQMKSLMEQKASTLAARSRAVSAARSQAASQWEDILGRVRYPVGEDYVPFVMDTYLNEARTKLKLSPDDMTTLSELMPILYNSAYSQLDGLDPSKAFHQVRFLMSDPIGQSMLSNGGLGDPEQVAALFSNMTAKEFDTYAAVVSEGIMLWGETQNKADNFGSPDQYPLGSVDYAAASWAQDNQFAPMASGPWWDAWHEDTANKMSLPSYVSTPYTQTSGD